MGKAWDKGGIANSVEMWREVLRVLRPGGWLLACGGTRTYHRMTCAIEDAGFEVRDSISWNYGSGFPKSLDCAKAIQGLAYQEFAKDARRLSGSAEGYPVNCSDSCRQCGVSLLSDQVIGQDAAPQLSDAPSRNRLYEPLAKTLADIGHRYTACHVGLSYHLSMLDCQNRKDADAWQLILEVSSFLCPACFAQSIEDVSDCATQQGGIRWSSIDSVSVVTAWAMSETVLRNWRMWSEPYNQYITGFQEWQGWGTALKPAHEPIVLARKPLSEATVAANVLRWGTGALAIDKCRIMPEVQRRDDDAYKRLSFLCASLDTHSIELSSVLDALEHIVFVLRSYSTDGKDLLHGAGGLDDKLPAAFGCVEMLVDRFLSNGDLCALNWLSIPNSLGDCLSCRRLCDELLHRVQEAAQVSLTSLLDALSDMCQQIREPKCTRCLSYSGLPSNSDAGQLVSSCLNLLCDSTKQYYNACLECRQAESTERPSGTNQGIYGADDRRGMIRGGTQGRWPANLITDGSPAVVAMFPPGRSSGIFNARGNGCKGRDGWVTNFPGSEVCKTMYDDSGSAARFFAVCPIDEGDYPPLFYCSKASKRERDAGLDTIPPPKKKEG